LRDKLKLYLDTSVISAVFDNKNPERQLLTKDFFKTKKRYDIFISEITLTEIENTLDDDLKKDMQQFISKFKVLKISSDVDELSNDYIHYKGITKNHKDDANHIAIATVNNMSYILSWNFRHIVRRQTKEVVIKVNRLKGYPHIEILTPGELL